MVRPLRAGQVRRWRARLLILVIVGALLPNVALADCDGMVYGTGGDGVWLKAAPSLSADRIMVLSEGTQFNLLQGPLRTENQYWWARIEVDGTVGWMVAEYLLMNNAPPPAATTPPAPAKPATPAAPDLTVGGWARVVDTAPAEGLRLRTAPDPAETLLAIVPEGAVVQVLGGPTTGTNGDPWYKVGVGNQSGWVDGLYLTPSDPPAAPTTVTPPPNGLGAGSWAQVSGTDQWGGLRLRTAPSPNDTLIATVPDGTRLHLIEGPTKGGNGDPWYRVQWQDSWGWVDGLYLVPVTAAAPASPAPGGSAAGNALAQLALAQVGKPYVWAATGPDAFDCSGLVVYVARKALGITLPRTADAQAFAGVHVDLNQLAPGDLVFYANTYQPGISHVGIYIGNNQWITAQDENTGVVVLSLDIPYWKTRYAGARRIT